MIIAATRNKLASLPDNKLYADTGNEEVNRLLSGWKRVIVGYKYEVVMKIYS